MNFFALKRLFVGTSLLLYVSGTALFAQTETKKDTVFLYNKKAIASITTTTGSEKTINKYNQAGLCTAENHFTNDTLNGSQKTWYQNGQISGDELYQNGYIISRQTWFENGLRRSTEHFKISSKENILKSELHGDCRYYYSNGQLREGGTYSEGVKHGKWVEYFETGIKKSEGRFANGYVVGKWTYWLNTGKPASIGNYIPDTSGKRHNKVLKHGKQIQYYNTGQMSEISHFKYGKLNGRFINWYENGQKKSEIDYCNGLQCGVYKTWKSNGDLYENINYVSVYDSSRKSMTVRTHGKYELNYDNGKPKINGTYKMGKENGLFIHYHQNGKESYRAFYQTGNLSGRVVERNILGIIVRDETHMITRTEKGINVSVKHGLCLYYTDDGVLRDSGRYDMNMKTGLWTSRHENGNLASRANYCGNILCGDMSTWYSNGNLKSKKTEIFDSATGFKGYTLREYKEDNTLAYYSLMNQNHFSLENILYFPDGSKRVLNQSILIWDKAQSSYDRTVKASRILTYHSNGQILSDEMQLDSRTVGRTLTFYMNGRIKCINDFSERGIAHGLSVYWDSEGGLISANVINNHYSIEPFTGSADSLYKLYNFYFQDQKESRYNPGKVLRNSSVYSYYHKQALRLMYTEQHGFLNGPYTMYYPDGKKLLETVLINNISNDTIRIWNPLGFLMSEKRTKNGLIRGRLREFYQTGILNSEVVYNDSGLVLSTQEMYENGRIKNLNRYLAGNRYSWIRHGKQESWHANGKPYNIYFSDSNKTIGAAYLYHPNGQLKELSYYKNGHRDSVSSTFDSMGNILYKIAYLNGVRHGKSESWWDNGQLKHHGWLYNEQIDSTWVFYKRDGSQESIRHYKYGLLTSAYSGRSCECIDSFRSKRGYAPLLNNLADLKTVNEWSFRFHKPFGEEYNSLFYVNMQTSSSQNSVFCSFDLISYKTLELQIPEKNGIRLILNPCFNIGTDRKPIPFTIHLNRLDKSDTRATLEPDRLAIRFNENVLHRWDSLVQGGPYRSGQIPLYSELLFNAEQIEYNSRELIQISNISATCFPHSEIGFTGTGIHIDTCEIDVNPEKNDFTFPGNAFSYEGFAKRVYEEYNDDYYRRDNPASRMRNSIFDQFTGIYARNCRVDLPASAFNTPGLLSVRGSNFMLGGTFVAGTVRLKATLSEGLNYSLIHQGKKIMFNSADIEKRLLQSGYRNVKTSYDSKTSEFIIYLFYTL